MLEGIAMCAVIVGMLLIPVVIGTIDGYQNGFCDCLCHKEGRPNTTRDGKACYCGDRW